MHKNVTYQREPPFSSLFSSELVCNPTGREMIESDMPKYNSKLVL